MNGIVDAIEFGFKGALRIGQTTRTLAETGLGWLFGEKLPAPALLRRTFEKLGATYVKLGQFIASSPSFFPREYVEEFQHCLDRTEALPFSTMQRILKRELKRPLQEVFSHIEETPLASASIAQVHAAVLTTGENVVIKIQKPGVRDVLVTDLNFLFVTAKVLEFLAPDLSRASLSAIVDEIQKTMMEECDFLKEAANIEEFDEFLVRTGNKRARVPRVYEHATTLQVLTMERFYGVPLTDLESIRKYVKDPAETLITAMNTWFSSLMLNNFFHADVHAGNLMVLEDGTIGFIDFGIVGRIRPETWQAMASLMEGMSTENFDLTARSMVQVGITKDEVDEKQLALDLKQLFARLNTFDAEAAVQGNVNEDEVSKLMLEIVALGEKNGLRFPREFALLLKQFLYFDRYTHILAPELNVYGDRRLQMLPE